MRLFKVVGDGTLTSPYDIHGVVKVAVSDARNYRRSGTNLYCASADSMTIQIRVNDRVLSATVFRFISDSVGTRFVVLNRSEDSSAAVAPLKNHEWKRVTPVPLLLVERHELVYACLGYLLGFEAPRLSKYNVQFCRAFAESMRALAVRPCPRRNFARLPLCVRLARCK